MGNKLIKEETRKLNAVLPDPTPCCSTDTAKSRITALNKTLAENSSSSTFIKFVSTDRATELTQLLEELEALRKLGEDETTLISRQFIAHVKSTVEKSRKDGNASISGKLLEKLECANCESIVAMAMCAHSMFIESEEDVRTEDSISEPNTPSSPSRKESAELIGEEFNDCKSAPANSVSSNEEKSMSIFESAMASVHIDDIDELFKSGSWLSSLLASVETLPVCVSISRVGADRKWFPLIYVNAYFEKTTGYSRHEVVGKSCRLLQTEHSEVESVERLRVALQEAKPIKVSITNYRKDGMSFRNLLSIKPIFDEEGNYRYVVGVQFAVTQEDATPARLKLAAELMKMLPDVIPANANDEW